MIDVVKKQNANARVLYLEIATPHYEAFDYVGALQNVMEKQPQIRPANGILYFYLFCPSSDELFLDEDFWVAREIIGHHEFSEEEDFEVFDLEQGVVFSIKVQLDMSSPETFKQICQYEKKYRSEISKENELAPTWRLSMPWDGQFSSEVTIDFFPKVES